MFAVLHVIGLNVNSLEFRASKLDAIGKPGYVVTLIGNAKRLAKEHMPRMFDNIDQSLI